MLEKLPTAVGEALGDVRAGMAQTVCRTIDPRSGLAALQFGSLAFADHAEIPVRYTADGPGLSPPLHWSGVPAAAATLVLIVEDADSPTPLPLVHAIAVALPISETGDGALPEAALSAVDDAEPTLTMGRNSLLQTRWLPPDPPPGHGLHRYAFQLFALGPGTALPDTPGRDALREAVLERGLAMGCLVGVYERPSGTITEGLASPAVPLSVATA